MERVSSCNVLHRFIQALLPDPVLFQRLAQVQEPPPVVAQTRTLQRQCVLTRLMLPAGCKTPPSGWHSRLWVRFNP